MMDGYDGQILILRDHTKNYSTIIYKNNDVDGSDDDDNGYDNDDEEEDSRYCCTCTHVIGAVQTRIIIEQQTVEGII